MKSIISGLVMDAEDFECNWQEFFIKRQEMIDRKTDYILMKEIETLLNRINDIELKNAISDIIIARENAITYAYYCQGFSDGIKQASLLDTEPPSPRQ